MTRPLTTRIIVFAKAPLPGRVKTRLIPRLGAVGAAGLYKRLLDHTVAAAVEARVGPVELCADGRIDTSDVADRALIHTEQGEGDLGARMSRAIARGLATDDAVVLIGTDCAVMDAATLRDAAQALDANDAVFAPAEDGGYVLVGMRRPVAEAFAGIEWSTSRVMAQTRDRLRDAGASWHELPTLWDVDEPGDVDRLQQIGFL